MKNLKALMAFMAILTLVCCKEEIDTSARYVFKEETIAGYLAKHEQYSEFYNLLGKVPVSPMTETTVLQLMGARGNFTVFAPTNEAIQIYMDSLVSKGIIPYASWEAFPDSVKADSIRQVIVYNAIIDSGDDISSYETASFPATQDAEIPMPNMYERRLSVHYCDDPDSILINDCLIDPRNRDIININGTVHQVHQVIAPSNNSMGYLLKKMLDSAEEGFLVTARLIDAAGLMDSLTKVRDDAYEYKYQAREIPETCSDYPEGSDVFYTPEHRYYGFTLFAETDEFWSNTLGKPASQISVKDVANYLEGLGAYPDSKNDENYEKEGNLIYDFITYHLLPMRLSTDRLVIHYNEKGYTPATKTLGVACQEFYTTMGKRRLMKLYESRESDGVYVNRFPNLSNGRRGTYHEIDCDEDKEGVKVGEPNLEGENNVRNGMIYPIDKLLVYDEATRGNLQKQRIRWNVTAMWPEFMNNDIRLSELTDTKHKCVYIPYDNQYKYLDDVDISEDTRFYYWTGRNNGWQNMQGDEMTIRGLFECTMRLPPVPARGTYELRFAIQCGGNRRGMTQFYWGKEKDKLAAMGIPMDLRQATDSRHTAMGNIPSYIGYDKDDDQDDDYNAEVDKRMRNFDFMKGCNQYCAGSAGATTMMRGSDICVRRIMVRQTMDPNETYYIRFKTVMDDPTRFFYMDYMEYCAKEVYDNPAEPEDIW